MGICASSSDPELLVTCKFGISLSLAAHWQCSESESWKSLAQVPDGAAIAVMVDAWLIHHDSNVIVMVTTLRFHSVSQPLNLNR